MDIRSRILLACTTAALGGLALAGCSSVFMDPSAYKIFQQQDVNIMEKSYAAADYIDQQAKNFVTHSALMKAVPLEDALGPQLTSNFAKLIPEQVGTRMAQLGYRVDLSDVSVSDNPNYLRPAMGANETARFTLGGSYARRRNDVDVALRIIDTQSNRVVASFDYTMPLNRDIGEMSEPEARIFKAPQ